MTIWEYCVDQTISHLIGQVNAVRTQHNGGRSITLQLTHDQIQYEVSRAKHVTGVKVVSSNGHWTLHIRYRPVKFVKNQYFTLTDDSKNKWAKGERIFTFYSIDAFKV
jgi:hypothetical protein